jgi:hypothetical protein
MLGLQVKGSLPKYSSHESSLLEVGLDLSQDLVFSVSRGANQNEISLRNHVLGVARNTLYLSDHVSVLLVGRASCEGMDLIGPELRPAGQ